MNDDISDRSAKLIESLGNLIGENEIEARKIMGDAHYEEMLAFIRASNALTVAQAAAHVELLKSSSFLRSALGCAVLTSIVLSTAWSFVFWFS
jgi:hypothetical protein